MKKFFAVMLFLFLSSSHQAYAISFSACMDLLVPKIKNSEREKNLNLVIEQIRRAGAHGLVEPLDRGEIKLKFSFLRAPWQSSVAGRVGWFGDSYLKVRDYGFTDEKERQLLVWQTAVSLFELQTRQALWSRRSMLTPDEKREFDLSMNGDSELFEYFLFHQPKEWRDKHLARLEHLEGDLYRLYQTLPYVQSEGLLPEKDPGRFWIVRAVLGSDGAASIFPNRVDFEAWKKGRLAEQLERRNGRNVLFNYYMNFVKRVMIASTALMIVSAVPDIPSYLESAYTSVQIQRQLDETPAKMQQAESPRANGVLKMVTNEELRLKNAIAQERQKQSPDLTVIQSLESDLADLYVLFPALNSR